MLFGSSSRALPAAGDAILGSQLINRRLVDSARRLRFRTPLKPVPPSCPERVPRTLGAFCHRINRNSLAVGAQRPNCSPRTQPAAWLQTSPSCRSCCGGRRREARRNEQPLIHDLRAMSASAPTADISLHRTICRYGPCMDGARVARANLTFLRSVRVQPCIRPIFAWRVTSVAMQPQWPLALM